MPTSIVGVAVLVIFLVPGFLWLVQRRAVASQTTQTALVETASLVSVSVCTNIAVVAMFGAIRALFPTHTPDVGLVLRGNSAYEERNFAYLTTWGFGLLTASCLIAARAGRRVPRRRPVSWATWRAKVLGGVPNPIHAQSAWERILDPPEGRRTRVECDLTDGSFLAGHLQWYATGVDETRDRDLVLGPPFSYWAEGKESELGEVDRVIISAASVRKLYVKWLDLDLESALLQNRPRPPQPQPLSRMPGARSKSALKVIGAAAAITTAAILGWRERRRLD